MDEIRRAEAAVILCAGGSRRMGRPKGLLRLRGEALLLLHVRALQAVADRVVVVLGAQAPSFRAILPAEVEVILNARWSETGPAESLSLALRALPPLDRVLVSPVDVPPPSPALLRALLATQAPAVPVSPQDEAGHPVLLSAEIIARCRAEPPEGGLRTWLHDARRVAVHDPWVSRDFDTPEAWEAFLLHRKGA